MYDVLIVGGGIAGSVAAKFAAKGGLKTLLIEKEKTPRNKTCSGIQFGYFDKIIGEKIPRERLCNIQLKRIKMIFPNCKSMKAPFKMFNFMRKPFDDWLNTVAQENGAEFRDECKYINHEEIEDEIVVSVEIKDGNGAISEKIKTRYLIDASGLRPSIRKKLRPQDFSKETIGSTVNYYIDATVDMDPECLYQFWNMEWNDAMFAWVYTKTLDDGKDYWVVGTGCNDGKLKERQESFYKYIQEKYNMKGEIVKKEGFATTLSLRGKDMVWLGDEQVLMIGDAAGLIDLARGVGMDAAAQSGRLVAKAMLNAREKGTKAFDEYQTLMKKIVKQAIKNKAREIGDFKDNDELQKHLDKMMLPMGLGMVFHSFLNKFRSPEKKKLLPP
ncbi:MAG: NAD(P)/FAD-dependent oxidoreductase [Candidatus Hodarchaeota archaeon]